MTDESCGDIPAAKYIRRQARRLADGLLPDAPLPDERVPPGLTANNRRLILIAYLRMKVDESDWHGVSDAANDLRVLEASDG